MKTTLKILVTGISLCLVTHLAQAQMQTVNGKIIAKQVMWTQDTAYTWVSERIAFTQIKKENYYDVFNSENHHLEVGAIENSADLPSSLADKAAAIYDIKFPNAKANFLDKQGEGVTICGNQYYYICKIEQKSGYEPIAKYLAIYPTDVAIGYMTLTYSIKDIKYPGTWQMLETFCWNSGMLKAPGNTFAIHVPAGYEVKEENTQKVVLESVIPNEKPVHLSITVLPSSDPLATEPKKDDMNENKKWEKLLKERYKGKNIVKWDYYVSGSFRKHLTSSYAMYELDAAQKLYRREYQFIVEVKGQRYLVLFYLDEVLKSTTDLAPWAFESVLGSGPTAFNIAMETWFQHSMKTLKELP